MLAFLSPFSRTAVNKVPQVVNMATPPPSAAHSPASSFGGDEGGGGSGGTNGVLNGIHMQNGVPRTSTGNEDHDRLLNAPPWNSDQEKVNTVLVSVGYFFC